MAVGNAVNEIHPLDKLHDTKLPGFLYGGNLALRVSVRRKLPLGKNGK